MKQLMPSKGKGLHRFSALTLSGTSLTDSTGVSSSSDTGSHGETNHTVEDSLALGKSTICVAADVEMSGPSASSTVESTNTQVQMHFPSTPALPYAGLPTHPPSVNPSANQATFDWCSDQSAHPPMTPSFFARPATPPSCNTSANSSIKPSSSVSQKWRVEDEENSMVSGFTSSSVARKRRAKTNPKLEMMEDLGQKLENFKGNFEKSYESGAGGSSSSTLARPSIPIHPTCQRARDRFLEVDGAALAPTEFACFLDLLVRDAGISDTYLSLAKDPDHLTANRIGWMKAQLEGSRKA
ncbi:hypothetical protein PISMIDRAFT_20228 [Pisolithus microcarpus 441]|uniref:Unplaced genomic scaffold scaffold_840, whole genome shotgun sequence n=1 Tax=Pisolithus microcarpus 441 TaxID=765257 RepID=A0A0C9XE97_9AGAM|nr:hypothetical protein PISMIDRAFT_20228 [Pisolithus microcarpus 441]